MKKQLSTLLWMVIGCLASSIGYSQGVSGVQITPNGATAEDTITITVNANLTCPTAAANANGSLANATVVRLHGGYVTAQGVSFTNTVAANLGSEAITGFTSQGNGIWVKRLHPRTYFNVPAGTPMQGISFVLNGGAAGDPGAPWNREGKICGTNGQPAPGGSGDFVFLFPIANCAAVPAITFTQSNTAPECPGTPVTLTASAGFRNYLWSNGDTNRSITVTNRSILTVRGITANGCTLISEADTVEYNTAPARPMIGFAPGGNNCSGTITLQDSLTGVRRIWSTGDTTRTITVSTSGIITLQHIAANGCSSVRDSMMVTVQGTPPAPILQYSSLVNIISSNVTNANRYIWFLNGVAISGAPNRFTYQPDSTGFYQLQYESNAGCLSLRSDSFQITRFTTPTFTSGVTVLPIGATADDTVTIIVDPFRTCPTAAANSSRSLQGTQFMRLHSGVRINNNNWQNVVGANPGTLAVTGFTPMSNGYWMKQIVPRTYYNIPAGTNIQALNFLMNGGPETNVWAREGKNCDANGSGNEAPGDAGNYYFEFPIGCGTLVAPQVNIIGNTTLCAGDSVILEGPANASQYMWSNGATTRSIILRDTATISLMVRFANGCPSLRSTAIRINNAATGQSPVITVLGSTELCEGSRIILRAPIGSTPVWSTGATTDTIEVRRAGVYSLQVRGGNNCLSATSSVTISSRPAPSTSASYNAAINLLMASDTATSYLWFRNGVLLPVNRFSFHPDSNGIYTHRSVSFQGCTTLMSAPIQVTIGNDVAPISGVWVLPANATADDTVTIIVDPTRTCPTPTANAGGSLAGSNQVRIHGGVTIGGRAWQNLVDAGSDASTPITGFSRMVNGYWVKRIHPRTYYNVPQDSIATGLNFVLNGGTAANVWAREGKRCDASGNGQPGANDNGNFFFPLRNPCANVVAPSVQIPTQTTFCQGDSVQLIGPDNVRSYRWMRGSLLVGTSRAISVRATDSLRLMVVENSGCLTPASSIVRINVLPRPATPVVQIGLGSPGSWLFTNAVGALFRWYKDGVLYSVRTSSMLDTVAPRGLYSVEVVSSEGCVSLRSAEILYEPVNAKERLKAAFMVAPNPFANELVLSNKESNLSVEAVRILSIDGKVLQTTPWDGSSTIRLEVGQLNAGMYLLNIHTKEGVHIEKLIKK